MEPWFQMVATIVCAVVASSGFWAYIQKRSEKKDVRTQMLIGLAHDRIVYLGMSHIDRGWITQDEYENLHDYLYNPYEKMGGNGSAKKVMSEVNKLPIHKSTYTQKNQQEESIMEQIMNYVKPELIVVAIVLYFCGMALKQTQVVKDKYIPMLLGAGGIVLCGIWVLATSPLGNGQEIAMAVFTAIVQGILMAGLSNYVNQIIKQANKNE